MMTSAQVVKTSVTSTNNSPPDYLDTDSQNTPSHVTFELKPSIECYNLFKTFVGVLSNGTTCMLVSNVVRKPLLIRFFVVVERRAVSDAAGDFLLYL